MGPRAPPPRSAVQAPSRMRTRATSTAAPASRRIAVNVAASIAPVPSENRASSEFDAKATSASRVKVSVRSTDEGAGRGRSHVRRRGATAGWAGPRPGGRRRRRGLHVGVERLVAIAMRFRRDADLVAEDHHRAAGLVEGRPRRLAGRRRRAGLREAAPVLHHRVRQRPILGRPGHVLDRVEHAEDVLDLAGVARADVLGGDRRAVLHAARLDRDVAIEQVAIDLGAARWRGAPRATSTCRS